MSLTEASYFGHPLFALAAFASAALLVCLARGMMRNFAQVRQQRRHDHQRRQFWGEE